MVDSSMPLIRIYNGDLSPYQLRKHIQSGEITKLARKLYVWGQPTPLQALALLCPTGGKNYVSGHSLYQLLTEQPLTFPISMVSTEQNLTDSTLVKAKRYGVLSTMAKHEFSELGITRLGLQAESPIGAARLLLPNDAIAFAEKYYSSSKGKQLLNQHLKVFQRVPGDIQKILNAAAIGTDSVPERRLVKLLRNQGYAVSCNVRIGDYLWDIVLDDYLIAIDVDGFRYHAAKDGNYDVFVTDRWKTNSAVSLGYMAFRYPAKCVMDVPNTILDQIRIATEHARKKPFAMNMNLQFMHGVRSWHPQWYSTSWEF